MRDVRAKPGAEVVQHTNRAPPADQFIDQMRTNEPGAAGDQRKLVHKQ
jgi:hypothetical protein